jgi:hypothetical protein
VFKVCGKWIREGLECDVSFGFVVWFGCVAGRDVVDQCLYEINHEFINFGFELLQLSYGLAGAGLRHRVA